MSYTHTILITGGTTGLGYQTGLLLARQHPSNLIIIASRTDKTSSALAINNTLSQRNVLFLPLDLSSTTNIRTFAASWASHTPSYPPIRALLLNAALQFPGALHTTPSGIESTFAITHLGHALLFYLLLSHFASTARVIITSSGTHDPAQKTGVPDAVFATAEELARPTALTQGNAGRQRYSSAKLANVLWTYALHRRLERLAGSAGGKHITVNAFDPGLMPGTGLAREASGIEKFIWTSVLPRIIPLLRLLITPNIHTPEESGASLAWLATGGEVEGKSGMYFEGSRAIESSVDSYREKKQEDLWRWTVDYLAEDEGEKARFEMV